MKKEVLKENAVLIIGKLLKKRLIEKLVMSGRLDAQHCFINLKDQKKGNVNAI